MDRYQRYRASMTEDDMLKAIREYVQLEGGFFFHVRDARGQDLEGLPDVLVLLPPRKAVAPGLIGLFEIKTQRDVVTNKQRQVLAVAEQATEVVSGVVRPNPKGLIELSLDDCLELLGKLPW